METFKAVMNPLHANLMLGTFGAVVVFLSGLLLPVSFVTGLLLWLDKRKNRKRVDADSAPVSDAIPGPRYHETTTAPGAHVAFHGTGCFSLRLSVRLIGKESIFRGLRYWRASRLWGIFQQDIGASLR